MKKWISLLLCSLLSGSAVAFDLIDNLSVRPNAGVDAFYSHLPYETDFGDDHFRKNYFQGDVYLGARLGQFFGVEVGYEVSHANPKHSFYHREEDVNGNVSPLILGSDLPNDTFFVDDQHHIAESYLNGWLLSAQGFLPVPVLCDTELLLQAGVAFLKMHYQTNAFDEQVIAQRMVSWDSSRKGVARLGVGLRHMFIDSFGARLMVVWENTSRLKGAGQISPGNVAPAGIPKPLVSDSYTAKPKDNVIVGFGLFWQMPG